MRTIVVDDEPWMLKRFEIESEGIADFELLGSFRSPLKALEFMRENSVELAFIDVEMPEMNGFELASALREIRQELIVIFVSAYESYMVQAFKTNTADYYIMKPYSTVDIAAAVERAKLLSGRLRKKVSVRTFGKFEIFVENVPVSFPNKASKELMALLIDSRGGTLTAAEAGDILWGEMPNKAERSLCYSKALRHLYAALKAAHIEGAVERNEQGIFIHTDILDCDLFRYLDGDMKMMRQFSGEYMTGYPWAEMRRKDLARQNELLERYSDIQKRNTLCISIRNLSDDALTLTYMNDSFLAVLGYTREEMKKKFNNSLRAVMLREDYERCIVKAKEQALIGEPIEVEYRLVNKNGDEIWMLGKSELPVMVTDSQYKEMSSILIDVSGLKAEQYNLAEVAQRDGLTGLLNRSTAEIRIQNYLKECGNDASGALILMDIDNFKSFNDMYDRSFADTVLTDVAAILTRSFRSNDIICRLGGDEMMVFLKCVHLEDDARTKLGIVAETLACRLKSKTANGELSCSFGGVMCPDDGTDYTALYLRADLALNTARETKNSIVWFSDIRLQVLDKLVDSEITESERKGHREQMPFLFNMPARLNDSQNLLEKIGDAISEIGRCYDISRVYVFEVCDDFSYAVNTFEWCACGVPPEIEKLSKISADYFAPYSEELFKENDGLLYCYDIRMLTEQLYDILAPQEIKSMLQCVLQSNGEIIGMVGFDECRQRRYWSGKQIKTLKNFTDMIGSVLYEYRKKHGCGLEQLQERAIGRIEASELD